MVKRMGCVVLGGMLAACVATPGGAPPPSDSTSEPPRVVMRTPEPNGTELAEYVDLQRQAMESDEKAWRVLYEGAKTDPNLSAQERRVRLALLLAAPHRPEPDRKEAERTLNALLDADGDRLSEPIKDLLTVSKHEIVKRGRLAERVKVLETQRNSLAQDVERLEQELAEATEKIQALTKIEKSIERPKNSEAP